MRDRVVEPTAHPELSLRLRRLAITSPAGTADTMGAMVSVGLDVAATRRIGPPITFCTPVVSFAPAQAESLRLIGG